MLTDWRIICPKCKHDMGITTSTENLDDDTQEYIEAFYCQECGAELVAIYHIEQTVSVFTIDEATEQAAVKK